jgi:hypothetical protein
MTPGVQSPFRPNPFFKMTRPLAAAVAITLAVAAPARAQEPDSAAAPPSLPAVSEFTAQDVPNDAGKSVSLTWGAAPTGVDAGTPVAVSRRGESDGTYAVLDTVKWGRGEYVDNAAAGGPFYYQLQALPGGPPTEAGPVRATAQWFNTGRTSVAVLSLLFFGLVLMFFWIARSGRELYVRRIPGIDAIEEAVGRATEMGRPVLYIPGIQDIDDIQTMASLVILESVSKLTAQYDTRIIVPTNYPVVMTLAQEMVKNGYLQAGRPEAYDEDSVRYVTTEQFAYVAAVNGIMLRDRPAANLFLGPFFAESLILAETGYSTRAIQVAGTANVHQLPFFVVACDYTLIGEELYAASAYLSKEPRLLSTLKGSDYMKVVLILIVLVGSVLESLGSTGLTEWLRVQ